MQTSSRDKRRQILAAVRRFARAGRQLQAAEPVRAAEHEGHFVVATQLGLNQLSAGRPVRMDLNPVTRNVGAVAVEDSLRGKPTVLDHLVWPEHESQLTEASVRMVFSQCGMSVELAEHVLRVATSVPERTLMSRMASIRSTPDSRVQAARPSMAENIPENLPRVLALRDNGLTFRQIAAELSVSTREAVELTNQALGLRAAKVLPEKATVSVG